MTYQIARDGVEIGTFTEEELIEAVEVGKVLDSDLAWTEGMEEWETVESLVEIELIEDESPPEIPVQAPPAAEPEPAKPAVRPLGMPHATTHYTAPVQPVQINPERYGVPPPQMARGPGYSSLPPGFYGPAGSAIASLVLGILSMMLMCFTGIPAIICGHIARGKIRRSAGAFSGHGMAVAGLVLGYVTTTISFLFLLFKMLGSTGTSYLHAILEASGHK